MTTLNLPNFMLGIPMWYLKPPTPPPVPQVVLTLVQPIAVESCPPPGPSNMPSVPKPAPPLPKKTEGKASKEVAKPHTTPPCSLCDFHRNATQKF